MEKGLGSLVPPLLVKLQKAKELVESHKAS